MKIIDILQQKQTLSFELFPPRTPEGMAKIDSVIGDMSKAKILPDFMSVTCGAGGTTRKNTATIAAMIQAHNVPALAHFSCIGDSRETVEETAQSLKSMHIENVLCLRGDIPLDIGSGASSGSHGSAFLHASELAKFLRERYDAASLCIGGACYPEKHPESANLDACIDMLKIKLDAGISFFTTQMFFQTNFFMIFWKSYTHGGYTLRLSPESCR